mgnify:FL=1|tara:strand:- start:244 stop:795 length:552 start_codon:yes stop_codon:yes gene_type:complete
MTYNLKRLKIKKEVFILTSKIYNRELLHKLKDYVIEKSSIIFSKNSNVYSARTDFKALINNDEFFGFLKESRDIIYNAWEKDYVVHDAWGCVYKDPNNFCKRHNHLGTTAFSGILYLTDHGPGTYFHELDITVKEEVGKFIIFDPMLYHEVPRYKYTKERVIVSFNCDEHQFLMNKKTTKILK